MDFFAYGSVFLSAFLAATLLPAQSELVLGAMLTQKAASLWLLVAVATLGNTLGAMLNWFLGTQINRFKHKKWFPVKEAALIRAERWYHKYGRWSLLLSWVPIIGDPLTLVAGCLKEPLLSFALIVGTAKLLRYVVVALLAVQLL